MTLERRLREQLEAEGQRLPEPPDRLQRVVRTGRRRRHLQNTTLGLVGVAVVLGAGAGWRAVTATRVAFEPGATPTATVTDDTAPPRPTAIPTPLPTFTPTAQPSPASTEDPRPAVPTVRVADLGAPVLAYNPGGSRLTLRRDTEEHLVWSGKVEGVIDDGRNGVVIQSARRLVWIPDINTPQPQTIVQADTAVSLRSMLPDGRVLYSTFQEPEDPEDAEGSLEHFFAVPLAAGSEPELITSESAHEAWTIGPATTAAGDLVMASCHMLCSVYSWPDPSPRPLYNGGGDKAGPSAGIDAMDTTPGGDVIALAEYVPAEGIAPPELVLLDGETIEPLARLPLPVGKDVSWAGFTVSVSPNGQRVLVTMRPSASGASGAVAVPRRVFLIEDALTDAPHTSRVDFLYGVLQWLE